jgi:hypothetical protein
MEAGSVKLRKLGTPQADKEPASTSFSPRTTGRAEVSSLQKPEPARVDLGAPCGPKPALDPLALKSLQNTPRKTDAVERGDRKEAREPASGGISTSSLSKSGDKQINAPTTLNKGTGSRSTNLKPSDATAMSAKSSTTVAFSTSNSFSSQNRMQDSPQSQQIRKVVSSEELQEAENTESHDGIRYF